MTAVSLRQYDYSYRHFYLWTYYAAIHGPQNMPQFIKKVTVWNVSHFKFIQYILTTSKRTHPTRNCSWQQQERDLCDNHTFVRPKSAKLPLNLKAVRKDERINQEPNQIARKIYKYSNETTTRSRRGFGSTIRKLGAICDKVLRLYNPWERLNVFGFNLSLRIYHQYRQHRTRYCKEKVQAESLTRKHKVSHHGVNIL